MCVCVMYACTLDAALFSRTDVGFDAERADPGRAEGSPGGAGAAAARLAAQLAAPRVHRRGEAQTPY